MNFCVLYYEILKEPDNAINLGRKTFDAAVQTFDDLCEQDFKDAMLICGLLRDNLTLWSDGKLKKRF